VPKLVSEEDFIDAWRTFGSPAKVAKFLGLKSMRSVYARRDRLMASGVDLRTRTAPGTPRLNYERTRTFEKRRDVEVKNGVVIVYSDAHFWPGTASLAYQALVELLPSLKPKAVIANGDLLDGNRISRHEPRGWLSGPTVREELEVLVERQNEIRDRAGKGCKLFRTLGNHDVRFERYIKMHAPELEDIRGTALEDFIPDWPCSWSVAINGNTLIKHRWKSGVHAPYRNTVEGGWNFVTGHLHSQKAMPFTDLRDDVRFGVDAGCLADPDHDAFDYTEDAPTGWRSGFVVLTYSDGHLLWPEFCTVARGRAWFRGAPVLGVRCAA